MTYIALFKLILGKFILFFIFVVMLGVTMLYLWNKSEFGHIY